MLNTIILLVIFIALIFHRYLTVFYEQGGLPYVHGFLIFANVLILLYLINFIWMFGIVFGIILAILTFLQIVYASLLWVFILPWLTNLYKKPIIPTVNQKVYATWALIIEILVILTILNFFISDYMTVLETTMKVFNNNYMLLVGIIISIIIAGNIVRSCLMKKMIK